MLKPLARNEAVFGYDVVLAQVLCFSFLLLSWADSRGIQPAYSDGLMYS